MSELTADTLTRSPEMVERYIELAALEHLLTCDLADVLAPFLTTFDLSEGLNVGTNADRGPNLQALFPVVVPSEIDGGAAEAWLVEVRIELLVARMLRALTPDVIEAMASRWDGLAAEHLELAVAAMPHEGDTDDV